MRLLSVLLWLLLAFLPTQSPSAVTTGISPDGTAPDLARIVSSEADRLRTLSSPSEAEALFVSRLAALTGLAPLQGGPKGTSPQSQEFLEHGGRLTAELAAWQLARSLQEAADLPDEQALRDLQPQVERQQWLLDESHPSLTQAAKLARVILDAPEADTAVDGESYERYAGFLDRAYPRLVGTEDAWLRLALETGPPGVQRRLESFWTETSQPADPRFAGRYFQTRLRPVLTAQVTALALRAEAASERQARALWTRLQGWLNAQRERKRLARLCGTWQWTVHNHKNHQDHKMVIAFPPPEVLLSSTPGVGPAKAVVLGDAVYLRWEFQGGVQEDSLLFTSEGQRLEGTFTNSAGAWGSISGKRTAGCEAKAPGG